MIYTNLAIDKLDIKHKIDITNLASSCGFENKFGHI